eukprot:3159851-Pleurochrysis_carterae.AAC.1
MGPPCDLASISSQVSTALIHRRAGNKKEYVSSAARNLRLGIRGRLSHIPSLYVGHRNLPKYRSGI